jgi:hypothetical protein
MTIRAFGRLVFRVIKKKTRWSERLFFIQAISKVPAS